MDKAKSKNSSVASSVRSDSSGVIKIKFKTKHSIKSDLPFYIILIVPIALVFLFQYLPMSGLVLAFKEWDRKLGIYGSPWNGLTNFIEIFKTPNFADSIWYTLYINVITMAIEFPMPIILALLFAELNGKVFKRITQTISYFPHFLSIAAVTGIVNSLLNRYGMINSVMLNVFGIEGGQRLMETPSAFLPTYIITVVWQSVGWGSIIYLAAICGVSAELYDAAKIDGANRFQQVIHVTLTGIAPTVGILLIMKMGGLFGSNFELVYGLQNPIGWKKEVISTAVYKFGIKGGQYALTTALGLMQGIVGMILVFSANFISKKVSNVSMW